MPGDLRLQPPSSGSAAGVVLPGLGLEPSPGLTPTLHAAHVNSGLGTPNISGFGSLIEGQQNGMAAGLQGTEYGLLNMDLNKASAFHPADLQQQQLYWQDFQRQYSQGLHNLTEQEVRTLKYLQDQSLYSRLGPRGAWDARAMLAQQGFVAEAHSAGLAPGARMHMQQLPYLGNGVQQQLPMVPSYTHRANDDLLAQIFLQRRNAARPALPNQVCLILSSMAPLLLSYPSLHSSYPPLLKDGGTWSCVGRVTYRRGGRGFCTSCNSPSHQRPEGATILSVWMPMACNPSPSKARCLERASLYAHAMFQVAKC
jgi:hypothetical protein